MRMERLIPEADREWFKGILEEVAAGEGPTELESRRATKDGRVVEVESTLTAVGEAGARKLAFTERDVTDKKASERHRKLLLRELDHRVKNTIATVEAIAERTIINSGHSMDDFADALRGRIRALGETHKALSEQRWEGIHLRELVERTLAPFSEDSRTHIEGRDVVLPVDLTLPLAMALHELVTNAVKYGSLSTPEGSLGVSWIIEETDESGPSLRLVWTEEGGPPVSEPEETGYGMIFLERGIAYEVGGSTEVHFGAGGLVCRIEIPLPVHEDV